MSVKNIKKVLQHETLSEDVLLAAFGLMLYGLISPFVGI
jgi:hypothetical protein